MTVALSLFGDWLTPAPLAACMKSRLLHEFLLAFRAESMEQADCVPADVGFQRLPTILLVTRAPNMAASNDINTVRIQRPVDTVIAEQMRLFWANRATYMRWFNVGGARGDKGLKDKNETEEWKDCASGDFFSSVRNTRARRLDITGSTPFFTID